MDNLPAAFADPATARLPATYEAAQRAIAECDRIDECKDWSDKAAALASYARQASDSTLRVMAVRIQARAERRCGELLKQIAPANGARTDLGTVPTRGSAAENAGLSERQRKTALRIASIPAREFERKMGAPTPPTITELAADGIARRESDTDADQAKKAALACMALVRFAEFCRDNDPKSLAQTIDGKQAAALRNCVSPADRWLDQFVVNLQQ